MNREAPRRTIGGAPALAREERTMEIRHKFWVEQRSHAIWAVELDGHEVVGCYGPLILDEVDDDLLETFEYSTGGVAWIHQNEDHFAPFVPRVPEIPGT
jgi:hypothetical protein